MSTCLLATLNCSLLQVLSTAETPLYLSWPASQLIKKENGCLAGLCFREMVEKIMARLPHFFLDLLVFYHSRVRARFTAVFPLASFVTWSLSTRQRSGVLEDFIRYIKQSLTSCIKKYHGTSQCRQLFSTRPDFSSLRDAGKYSFICFSTKMSFFMSSIQSLLFHRACEHLQGLKARHFILQFHYSNVAGTSTPF